MSLKHRFGAGFKIRTNRGNNYTQAGDALYPNGYVTGFVDSSGNTYPFKPSSLSIDELNSLGIDTIYDAGFDNSRYELTGIPTDIAQPDGSFIRDYTGAITEKVNYEDTLRQRRINECQTSFDALIEEGYDFNDGTLAVKVKSDQKSVQSFAISEENIAKGNPFARNVKDYYGNINSTATVDQIAAISSELRNYYTKLLDKKFLYYKQISEATREELENMLTFDWTLP